MRPHTHTPTHTHSLTLAHSRTRTYERAHTEWLDPDLNERLAIHRTKEESSKSGSGFIEAINKPVDLAKCLRLFTEKENLSDDDAWYVCVRACVVRFRGREAGVDVSVGMVYWCGVSVM